MISNPEGVDYGSGKAVATIFEITDSLMAYLTVVVKGRRLAGRAPDYWEVDRARRYPAQAATAWAHRL